jgi:DNA repair exonuclease SbcCD ATPase subunit
MITRMTKSMIERMIAMKSDKKIKIQQRMIEELRAKNESLKAENEKMLVELELEKVSHKEEHERVSKLIAQLEKKKEEYTETIENVKKLQSEYKDKIKEITELKKAYKKEMNSTMNTIKKSAKKVNKSRILHKAKEIQEMIDADRVDKEDDKKETK